MTANKHPRRLTLLIGLGACLLVAHLVERFPATQKPTVGASTHCRCLLETWQILERESVQWVAPAPVVRVFRPTVVVDFVEMFAESHLPQMPLNEKLSNRPPPSC